MTTSLMIDKEW